MNISASRERATLPCVKISASNLIKFSFYDTLDYTPNLPKSRYFFKRCRFLRKNCGYTIKSVDIWADSYIENHWICWTHPLQLERCPFKRLIVWNHRLFVWNLHHTPITIVCNVHYHHITFQNPIHFLCWILFSWNECQSNLHCHEV